MHIPEDEAAARKAIEAEPENANAHFNLGFILARDPARVNEAETALRKAIALEPNNAKFIYRLGLLLHEKAHRFHEAEIAFHQAIELEPDDPYYYGGFISLLVQQSRQSEVQELSTKMRQLLNASENWYGLATLDAILGNVEAAISHLAKAAQSESFDRAWAQIDPDLASIRYDPRFDQIINRR